MIRHQLILLCSLIHLSLGHIGLLENDLGFGKWFRPILTYKIVKYPEHRRHPRMIQNSMQEHVDKSLEEAIKVWKPVVPVIFLKTESDNADVKVFFWSRDHGDGYIFDGKGGEVAHTFYPDMPRRGEIHLDDDEPWAPDGRNLEWVLAHELGHALGIPHQKGPSLMEQGYRGYHRKPELSLIDIMAAKTLYN